MPFLSRFDAVIFDLNGTLAEGFDRFGSGQDYMGTYRRLGGAQLSADALRHLLDKLMAELLDRYETGPADPFPQLGALLADLVELPAAESRLIEELVAEHEMGTISTARVELIGSLGQTHQLGLISDLWAPSRRYRDYLERLGLTRVFGSMVFSCEQGAVKPSPRLFRRALEDLGVTPQQAVFVGDKEARDVAGAANCGIATVLIDAIGRGPQKSRPDRVIPSLEALADLA